MESSVWSSILPCTWDTDGTLTGVIGIQANSRIEKSKIPLKRKWQKQIKSLYNYFNMKLLCRLGGEEKNKNLV